MFDKNLIPPQNPKLNQLLTGLYGHVGASAELKAIIDKKLDKVDQTMKEKILSTLTISEYFDQQWKQPDLKDTDKELVIKKLEAIQQSKKLQIKNGEQTVAKTPANLDAITTSFKMTPFEEFTLQEKIKEVKKKKNLEIESALMSNHKTDLEVLHALNRPFRSVQNSSCPEIDQLHYTAGLCDADEHESLKQQKAADFVKKIKDDKKALRRKFQQIERSQENRELEELERMRQKRQEEEEQKHREKKARLEAQIQLLKARSETRIKETNKWEEDYRAHINRKPLYKEIEEKFNKGYLMPELEERKKKLQEIRDFHKPIAREELMQHEQKVKRILDEQNIRKKEESESFKWQYKRPTYASKHHKEFAEEVSKIKKQKDVEQLEKLKKREKVMELMQEVKEKHAPKVDPQKELELLTLIEKLKKKNKNDNRSRTIGDEEEEHVEPINPRKLGNDYLKSVKELVQRKKKEAPRPDTETNSERNERDNKHTVTSMKSEPTLKKINYLAELRKENKLQHSISQVDNIIKNKRLESQEKKGLLKSEIEKLEEKAKRKEMVRKFKVKKGFADVDEDDEVDQYYISAIKAKLEMLGN